MSPTQALVAQRLRLALDLFDAGVELKRQGLRRQFPELDEAAVERLVGVWLAERPGAELGDGAGPFAPRQPSCD